jgi:hypothetical protein
MEEIDAKKIAEHSFKETESIIDTEEVKKEAHKNRVLKAAAIMEMLDTEGGAVLIQNLEELYNRFNYAPEQFLATVSDAQGGQYTRVDTSLVARLAGAREAIQSVKSIFEQAEHVVKAEALKK